MNNVNYDKISEIYDAVRSGDPEVIAYILENKVLGHDSRILEIGCGSGNNRRVCLVKRRIRVRIYVLYKVTL
jgi:protein-L-isoaspartate O-methyltransferase